MNTDNERPQHQGQVLLGLVVVVLLGIAGCSLPQSPGPSPSSGATAPASPPPATTIPSVPAPASPSASAPSAQPTPVLEQPVAMRQGNMEQYPVVASVYPVGRNGTMATVNVRLKANKPSDEFGIFGSLNDGNPQVLARSGSAPDGVKMIDGAHHKAYLAATTPDGTCLCQPQHAHSVMFPDRTNEVWVSVTFAAPPADVTTVDVVVPRFGTFSRVPIR